MWFSIFVKNRSGIVESNLLKIVITVWPNKLRVFNVVTVFPWVVLHKTLFGNVSTVYLVLTIQYWELILFKVTSNALWYVSRCNFSITKWVKQEFPQQHRMLTIVIKCLSITNLVFNLHIQFSSQNNFKEMFSFIKN